MGRCMAVCLVVIVVCSVLLPYSSAVPTEVQVEPAAVQEAEENVHEDRKISDYIFDNALFQLLEGQRIKEGIRDREQDMWAY